jgi:death-on-curing protein
VSDVEYLELADMVKLVQDLDVGPVRDIGLLDSAVMRARSSAFGEDAYPTLALKAAALLHSIAGNHALVDGNKRLAWAATRVFLGLNGVEPTLTPDEKFNLVMDVAKGILDLEAIAERLGLP